MNALSFRGKINSENGCRNVCYMVSMCEIKSFIEGITISTLLLNAGSHSSGRDPARGDGCKKSQNLGGKATAKGKNQERVETTFNDNTKARNKWLRQGRESSETKIGRCQGGE